MCKRRAIVQFALCLLFTLLCGLIIFPFWLTLSASLTGSEELAKFGYSVLPNPIDLSAYKVIFENPEDILNAYGVTILFSAITMVLSVLLMAMIAYPLSRKSLRGRGKINFYLYFPMLFSGGLIPTYIIYTNLLHLDNTLWVYILPALVNPWYVFMIRTFFQGIPGEIIESTKVDGASEYTILFKIIIPMSKPVLATVALFMFLHKWNDWNTTLIYISNKKLYSLQYLLQSIMENINQLKQNPQMALMMSTEDIPSETVRMAMSIVVAGPALVIFPFFQKYFVKGLTVGAVKG